MDGDLDFPVTLLACGAGAMQIDKRTIGLADLSDTDEIGLCQRLNRAGAHQGASAANRERPSPAR